jgi:hypothetical protein
MTGLLTDFETAAFDPLALGGQGDDFESSITIETYNGTCFGRFVHDDLSCELFCLGGEGAAGIDAAGVDVDDEALGGVGDEHVTWEGAGIDAPVGDDLRLGVCGESCEQAQGRNEFHGLLRDGVEKVGGLYS